MELTVQHDLGHRFHPGFPLPSRLRDQNSGDRPLFPTLGVKRIEPKQKAHDAEGDESPLQLFPIWKQGIGVFV